MTPRNYSAHTQNAIEPPVVSEQSDWRVEARDRLIEKLLGQEGERLWQEDFPNAGSDIACRERQRGLMQMALDVRANWFLTIQFERALTPDVFRDRLKRFGAVLDSHLLGHDWHRNPNRSVWIAVAEDSRHAHLMLRTSTGRELTPYVGSFGFRSDLTAYWTEIVRRKKLAASVHVARLQGGDDVRVAAYIAKNAGTKAFWNARIGPVFVSGEFHGGRQARQ